MKLVSLLIRTVGAVAIAFSFEAAHAAVNSAAHTVIIEGMKFVPDSLTVRAGDTVVWVNKDFFPHTATGQKKEFDSGEIKSTETWRFVTERKGTFPYICNYHPTMKAMITVK